MIAYTPRRCVSTITSRSDDDANQSQQDSPQYPNRLYRVPSNDDVRAFRRTDSGGGGGGGSATSGMMLPQASPHAGGGLPVYSPSSHGARQSRRSGSRRLSSLVSSSASSLASLASPRTTSSMYDADESIYAKLKPSPSSPLRTHVWIATVALTALFQAYAAYRGSAISANLSALRLDLRTLLFDHNRDRMALSEAEALEKEWQGDIDYTRKEIARRSMTRSMLSNDFAGGQNEALLKKEEALQERIDRMQKDIAEISRMEAIER